MPTPTYDLITSQTLSTSATNVYITSLDTIAAAYRDLVLVIEATGSGNDFYPRVRYNGISSTVYSWVSMHSTGSATGSFYGTENGQQLGNNQFFSTSAPSLCVVQFFDFSRTDKNKSILVRIGRAGNGTEAIAGSAGISGAITQMNFYSSNGASLAAGSTFYLYGIGA